jgi:sec-independent protein translocase protein TatC
MQTTYPQAAPEPRPEEEAVMSWLDHARELRDRLLKACIAVFVGLLVGFFVVTWNDYMVITGLINHFAPNGVQTVKPAEPFTETLKLALAIGIALGMPVIVYQLLAFVVPALTRTERRVMFLILPFITICFISGLLFGYFVTIPAAFRFLLNFGPGEVIENKPTLSEFLSLFARLELINGVLFELPVLVYSVIWLGAVERKTLVRYRRYTVLVIVIISAIITPTGDPVNLAFTAIPMYLLYELGLLLAWIAPRRRKPASTPSA